MKHMKEALFALFTFLASTAFATSVPQPVYVVNCSTTDAISFLNVPAASVQLTNVCNADTDVVAATNITAGTLGTDVLISTVPALNGSRLTNLTAANIASGSLGAGVIASSITRTAYTPVIVSSETEGASINIASTAFVGIATATITLSGNRPIKFDHYELINNSAGASRNYTIEVAIDGVGHDPHVTTDSGNASTIDSNFDYIGAGLSSGSHTFSVWIHSSSSVGTQTVTDYHFLVTEY